MKTIVIETVVKELYEAEDGKQFDNKTDCEIYEKYYKISLKDLLSPFLSFDNWEEPFTDGNCFVFKEIPEEILLFIRIIFPRSGSNFVFAYKKESWRLEEKDILLFYYDITEIMNGYGNAYWRFIGTKKSLNAQIKFCRKRIEEIENFEKSNSITY